MWKKIIGATLITLTAVTINSLPIHAQSSSTTQTESDPIVILNLNRAKNLARQAAEETNGGLGNYRAESSMHGPASEASYKDNGNGTWTFTFKGSRPDSTTPTVESLVTVSQDGSKINVDYNGPIRSSGSSTP
jgi:hypothetical protein